MFVRHLVDALVPVRLGSGYRWLLGASWSTNLGDGIRIAAGPLLVASLTDDAFVVSMAALLGWAPPLLFGLGAGVLADRVDRRLIMIVANAARGIILLALAASLLSGTVTVAGVLVALALIATAEVFADGTAMTVLPMLVDRDDLALANARLQIGYITLNQLGGPPIGALLFAAGTFWPFAGQAVLVALGLLMLRPMSLPAHHRDDQVTSVRRDLAVGFRWIWCHPAVRTLALAIFVFNVTFGAAWSILVLYATQRLGMGPVGFGLLTTASAVGGVVGTLSYGWITRRMSLGNIMRVGLVIETVTHLVLALTRSQVVALVTFFVFGAHAFVWLTTSVTVRQRAVPSGLQGRVGGVYVICVFGGLVIGSAVGGALAAGFGVTAPFWFAFAGSAVFLVLLWRQLAGLDHSD